MSRALTFSMPHIFGCPFIDQETDWDKFERLYPQFLQITNQNNIETD